MQLKQLSIVNYKNIAEEELNFSDKVNCLIGDNGMGKTNVLDAIYYLSLCRSFAPQPDNSSVIRHGEPYMMLRGHYLRRDMEEEISIALQRGRRKVVRRGGKEYKRLSAHVGLLPVVMVSPQDWDLIRGSGAVRRNFIDRTISQCDESYMEALNRYNKALEQRNALLHQEVTEELLYESVEVTMCESAAVIHAARQAWMQSFAPLFDAYYRDIAGEGEHVTLRYRSHLNDNEMRAHLNATRQRDLALGYTSRGIHRDDIEMLLGEHDMRHIGSQGQCKTYTIALRMAEFETLKQRRNLTPILLLDDIFDRLDATRVERIIEVVSSDRFGQIFITDTNRTHLDSIIARRAGDYRMMRVENGKITLLNQ